MSDGTADPSGVTAGLCSVTLRSESIETVARIADECALRAIEWGADVHVPPGDHAAAARARAFDADIVSYGSYLLAAGLPERDEYELVLDSALAIGATNVRVWTPFGSDAASNDDRGAIAECLGEIAVAAAARSLTVSLEFHGHTLTATAESTVALLAAVPAPNLFTYWQPPYWRTRTDTTDLEALHPRLSHVHVYEWDSAMARHPLHEGAAEWTAALRALDPPNGARSAWTTRRAAFLEFVVDDDIDRLRADAKTLHDWIAAL